MSVLRCWPHTSSATRTSHVHRLPDQVLPRTQGEIATGLHQEAPGEDPEQDRPSLLHSGPSQREEKSPPEGSQGTRGHHQMGSPDDLESHHGELRVRLRARQRVMPQSRSLTDVKPTTFLVLFPPKICQSWERESMKST